MPRKKKLPPATPPRPRFVSVPQAATVLGITPSLLTRYCRAGRIGEKVGCRWLISSEELDAFRKVDRHPGGYRDRTPAAS